MKKLLLISSNTVHTPNFYDLVKDYFQSIEVITNGANKEWKFKNHVLDFSLRNPYNFIATPNSIAGIIKIFKPDIVHIHQANSMALYALLACRKFDIPTVLTAWGSDVLSLPYKNVLLRKMVQYNLRHATALTSDSVYMAEEMSRLSGRALNEILIANFGINVMYMPCIKENIIYSNRLHKPLYRIDKIIEGFTKFYATQTGKDYTLVIGATGEQTETLKEIAATSPAKDAIKFVGWLDKDTNASYYAKSRYYISIPQSDATSISLLEAMAMKCFPIVSDLPANREWIVHTHNGFVIANDNTDFIEDAVKCYTNEALIHNEKLIAEKATKDVNRAKFIHLYSQLLHTK